MHSKIRLKVNPIEYFSGLRKSMFDYKNKAHDFESPTWDWLLKRKIPGEHSPDSYKSSVVLCDIRVVAWDKMDQPRNDGMTQFFSPDKQGEKGAHMYARTLVEDGYALMSEVIWSIRFVHSGDAKHVQSQTYESSDL
jgi:hypothetical protein